MKYELADQYLTHQTLWELYEFTCKQLADGEEVTHVKTDFLIVLLQQAIYPLWPDGHLSFMEKDVEMWVTLYPVGLNDGVPEHAAVWMDNGVQRLDILDQIPPEEILEGMESNKIIHPSTVVGFVLENYALMKKFKRWLKKKKGIDHKE